MDQTCTRELEATRAPTADLTTYHRNPRRGNVDRIAESLRVNGQYRTLCVNLGTHTGRPHEVLAGNHTLLAARQLGWDTIAVTYVDVDDDQAARIVVVDNRSAELADNDDELLAALLADLSDLDGTGYTDDELGELTKSLAEPEFAPEDDDVRLDRKSVTDCPKCGHTFTPTTRSVTDEDAAPWEN